MTRVFPPPPRINRKLEPVPAPVPKVGPVDERRPKVSAELTDNETAFIIRTTLRPDQQEDTKLLKFIMEYLVCRNTGQAARLAGYTYGQGYSLRNKPEVHNCIQTMTEKAVLKLGYDATEVIERVKEIAFLDPIEFENPDGTYKTSISQIAPEVRRGIKSFKVKNLFGTDPNNMKVVIGQLVSVELFDKIKTLEFLGREKQLFKETRKLEHDITKNMADVLLASKDRANNPIDITPKLTGEIYDDDREQVPSDEG